MPESESPRARFPRFALLDLLLGVVLLGALNFFFSRQDPGWFGLNPTPWLLLPLLLGARYGFTPGFLTGLVLSLGLLALRWLDSLVSADTVGEHALLLLSLPLTGLIAGEAHGLFARRLATQDRDLITLANERDILASDLDLTSEARWQLQERLALLHAETATLDVQLRALFQPGAGPVFPGLLRLLGEVAGVTDAAVYHVQGGRLVRAALAGSEAALPAELAVRDTEIAAMALTKGTLVTVKETWDAVPVPDAALIAALPCPEHAGGPAPALLLIHHMEMSSLNWAGFARIQAVCRWVARFMALHSLDESGAVVTGGPLLTTPSAFTVAVQEATRTHASLRVPSVVAAFHFTHLPAAGLPEKLAGIVGSLLRSTDIAALSTDATTPGLAVLMPFEPSREAGQFIERARRLIALDPALRDIVEARLTVTDAPPDAPALPEESGSARTAVPVS